MWKCMMCETNNADDAESCFICYTTKADTKRYYDRLKNFSYLDDYKEYNPVKSSSSKPEEIPKPVSSPKPVTPPPKPSEPVKTSTSGFYDDFDDDWIDSIGVSKKKKRIKIVTAFGKGEKVFIFFLTIITGILFDISISNDNPLSMTLGFLLILIVSTYIKTKYIPINCSNNILKFFIKLIIFFTICFALIVIALILRVILSIFR